MHFLDFTLLMIKTYWSVLSWTRLICLSLYGASFWWFLLFIYRLRRDIRKAHATCNLCTIDLNFDYKIDILLFKRRIKTPFYGYIGWISKMTSSRDVFLVFFPFAQLVCSYLRPEACLFGSSCIILLFEVIVLKNIFPGAICVWWDWAGMLEMLHVPWLLWSLIISPKWKG